MTILGFLVFLGVGTLALLARNYGAMLLGLKNYWAITVFGIIPLYILYKVGAMLLGSSQGEWDFLVGGILGYAILGNMLWPIIRNQS